MDALDSPSVESSKKLGVFGASYIYPVFVRLGVIHPIEKAVVIERAIDIEKKVDNMLNTTYNEIKKYNKHDKSYDKRR